MSGIGFQKLNGNGTVATAQLTKLGEIDTKLTAIKSDLLYSDLRKEAKELFNYHIPYKLSKVVGSGTNTLFPDKYGRLTVSTYLYNHAGSSVIVRIDFKKGSSIVHTKIATLPDTVRETSSLTIFGVFDSVVVTLLGSTAVDVELACNFFGFGADPNPDDVSDLVSLATNLGYIITDNNGNIITG